jgi:hypothetical protein
MSIECPALCMIPKQLHTAHRVCIRPVEASDPVSPTSDADSQKRQDPCSHRLLSGNLLTFAAMKQYIDDNQKERT